MAGGIFDSKGRLVSLGQKIGGGGEGTVFELACTTGLVAKLYHRQPTSLHQAKLAFMARSQSANLTKFTSWPKDTLHEGRGGRIVGFVMDRVVKMAPLQTLYSPAHRKQEYPTRAWDFLVATGRNTAAAFDSLHAQGVVLGDVNHGNALCGSNAAVALIDADSYQVRDGPLTYYCGVGVAHYTPPELQGMSFAGVARQANHDCFGLALLLFHLLFGGRHPFAGVPHRADIDGSIEGNIAALRFAYAHDAQRRGLTAPPNALPLTLVPPSMTAMFERAFTEEGRAGRRPNAKAWVDALDELRVNLATCNRSRMHMFSGHLAACPWCALETKGVVYFLLPADHAASSPGAPVDITQIWRAIEAFRAPLLVEPRAPAQFAVKPVPLPAGFISDNRRVGLIVFAGVILFVLTLLTGLPTILTAAATIIGAVAIWSYRRDIVNKEVALRANAVRTANASYDQTLGQFRRETFLQDLQGKKNALMRLKQEFGELPGKEQRERERLRASAEARQKKTHLDRFHIDQATFPGIGPAKRAALRSYGIETAADVNERQIRNIKGFGEVLTKTLINWRRSKEQGFRFDVTNAVSQADLNRIASSANAEGRRIELALRTGHAEMRRLVEQQKAAADRNRPLVEAAAAHIAQAESNWAAIQSFRR